MNDEMPTNQLNPNPLTPSGDPVSQDKSNTPLSTTPAPEIEDKKPKKKLVLIVLLILVLLVGAVSAWLMTHKKSSSSTNQNTASQTAQEKTQQKLRQLCYIKVSVECYSDVDFKNVAQPKVFNGLNVVKVVPSPKDDQLAILAGTPGSLEVYIADSKLQPTKINLGNYKKSDYSLSWLEDQSALIFEADANKAQSTRIIVKYDIKTQQITELTGSSKLSMDPQVSGNSIVFQRYDLAANPTSVWEWYKMTVDGNGEGDLGINGGYGGTIRSGKLIVASDKFIEVDIQTKQQKQLTGDQLKVPTSTGSGLITLSDGRLVFTFKQDENQTGPNDRIAIVDTANNKTTILNNDGVSEPFQTAIFQR
ncbi:MAG: hypothetical protein AAB541_03490 [Patescibacteria group bacterium]